MKTPNIFRQALAASVLATLINLTSSCNSCDRNKQETGEGENTYYENETGSDTLIEEESVYNDNSGSGGMPTDSKTRSTTIKTSTSTASSSKTSTSGSTEKKLTEEEITNQIENSDAKSGTVDKNGNPVRNSGTSGTGQGTGTGSTGNNSRVTTREAQRGN